MHPIDESSWARKEVYDFFSPISNPFYSLTFPLDVTNLYRYTKERGLSFYYGLIYLCTQAVNRVENFLYTIEEGRVCLYDRRIPSFTDLEKGGELFRIVTMPCEGSMDDFCRAARAKSTAQAGFVDYASETRDLIYFSCVPWMDITSLTNERDLDPEDAVPRIAWGKYTEESGRKTLHLSLEVNHRFIDGVHIGRFYEELCRLMEALGKAEIGYD